MGITIKILPDNTVATQSRYMMYIQAVRPTDNGYRRQWILFPPGENQDQCVLLSRVQMFEGNRSRWQFGVHHSVPILINAIRGAYGEGLVLSSPLIAPLEEDDHILVTQKRTVPTKAIRAMDRELNKHGLKIK